MFIIERLKEPSTWNAFAIMLTAAHFSIPATAGHWLVIVAAVLSAAAGALVKEGNTTQ